MMRPETPDGGWELDDDEVEEDLYVDDDDETKDLEDEDGDEDE